MQQSTVQQGGRYCKPGWPKSQTSLTPWAHLLKRSYLSLPGGWWARGSIRKEFFLLGIRTDPPVITASGSPIEMRANLPPHCNHQFHGRGCSAVTYTEVVHVSVKKAFLFFKGLCYLPRKIGTKKPKWFPCKIESRQPNPFYFISTLKKVSQVWTANIGVLTDMNGATDFLANFFLKQNKPE